jgi:hypothetical protein
MDQTLPLIAKLSDLSSCFLSSTSLENIFDFPKISRQDSVVVVVVVVVVGQIDLTSTTYIYIME